MKDVLFCFANLAVCELSRQLNLKLVTVSGGFRCVGHCIRALPPKTVSPEPSDPAQSAHCAWCAAPLGTPFTFALGVPFVFRISSPACSPHVFLFLVCSLVFLEHILQYLFKKRTQGK